MADLYWTPLNFGDTNQVSAMKSERGQVQESNLLADKIEQKLVQIRPFLPAVAGLILAGVLALIGYGVYAAQRESRAARGWSELYFSDTQVQDLEPISKDYEDTSAGLWARMTIGDRSMAQAMEKWNVDRSIADQRFQEAADDYRLVAARGADPFVKSRALFGLAQALEGLGKRAEAVEAYRDILGLTGLPTEYLAEVSARIKWLEGKEGESFYAWYNERRTTAPATGEGSLPQGLPSLPDIEFPPLQPLPGASGDAPPTSQDKP
ncbi:MAG: tetratricopeptide repeat protein [Planctomycetota bacterium]